MWLANGVRLEVESSESLMSTSTMWQAMQAPTLDDGQLTRQGT